MVGEYGIRSYTFYIFYSKGRHLMENKTHGFNGMESIAEGETDACAINNCSIPKKRPTFWTKVKNIIKHSVNKRK